MCCGVLAGAQDAASTGDADTPGEGAEAGERFSLELERPAWRFAQPPAPPMIEPWSESFGDPDRPLAIERSGTRFVLREGADFEAATTDRERRLDEVRRLMRTDVVIPALTLGRGGTGQVGRPRRGLRLLAPVQLDPDQDQAGPTQPITRAPVTGPVLVEPIPDGSIKQDSAIVADASSVSLEWDLTGGWALRGTGARRRFADEINYVAVSAEAAYPLGTTGGLRIGYDLFRQALPGEQTFEPELPQDRVFMEFQWRF